MREQIICSVHAAERWMDRVEGSTPPYSPALLLEIEEMIERRARRTGIECLSKEGEWGQIYRVGGAFVVCARNKDGRLAAITTYTKEMLQKNAAKQPGHFREAVTA